jgi:transcriptional regulator with XRE-family HTH domain
LPGAVASNVDMRTSKRKPSPEIRSRLASNIKRLREARGYTQGILAKLCRLNVKYISNVEQGTVNITLANLEALARGLRCSEEDLLTEHPIDRGPKQS